MQTSLPFELPEDNQSATPEVAAVYPAIAAEVTAAEAAETAAGFRLERVEVLNWGTFHERPWDVSLNGGTALLTGANGSGKSTLVDAVVTLLVPNRGGSRSYNKASSASGKSERDEKSYVQGAYGRTRSEESYT